MSPIDVRLLIRYETDVEDEVKRLTDQARALNQLSALFQNNRLRDLARENSRDMATRGGLSQLSRAGTTLEDRLRAARIRYREAGMTLHRKSPGIYAANDTLRDRLDGWLNVPEDRAKVLNRDYYATGVGAYRGSDGYVYITQIFIQPRF